MMDWIIPLCTVAGALLMMVYGFLDSGEKFNVRKFLASGIMAAMVALTEGLTTQGDAIMVTGPGLAGVVISAILTGAGTVYTFSQGSKLLAKIKENKVG